MRTAHVAIPSSISSFISRSLCLASLLALSLGPPSAFAQREGPGQSVPAIETSTAIYGLRIEEDVPDHGEPAFIGYEKEGRASIVRNNREVEIILFGSNLEAINEVGFTSTNCTNLDLHWNYSAISPKNGTLRLTGTFPNDKTTYKLCVRSNSLDNEFKMVNGGSCAVTTDTPAKSYYFPFWIQIVIITILLTLSGLFSGLNLGLMALSPQELILIEKSGSKTEQRYAQTILPVRQKGNFLLCSLLIGNVMVNSGISILLDDLTGSGYVALISSSAGIVIFGEIFPQSLCVKKGLAVGAKTIGLTKLFMLITWPIAFPISLLLDLILGDEVVAYDRKRLMELIKMSTQEEGMADELKIAVGAMEMSDKTVKDVMTKIDDVFMLPDTTTLNTKTVAEILRMGYTRIPVYSGDRNNVVNLLFVKDLALLDPDDNFTIQTVCKFHQHTLRVVLSDTPLRIMLEEFKKGDYHLAMVQEIVQKEDQDPSYQLVGVVTLEDIVEEILQAEIVDETDAVMDNVSKMRRKAQRGHELALMLDAEEPTKVISVQMQLVTLQWLTTNVKAFQEDFIARGVLEKLIRQNVRRVELTHLPDVFESKSAIPRTAKLFTKQEYSERFILILEGRAIVTIGQDSLTFEAGPWQSFGHEMLDKLLDSQKSGGPLSQSRGSLMAGGDMTPQGQQQASSRKTGFVPDFNMVVMDTCTFLEVSCSAWLRAYNSTQLSRGFAARYPLMKEEDGDERREVAVMLGDEEDCELLPLNHLNHLNHHSKSTLRPCQSSAFLTHRPY